MDGEKGIKIGFNTQWEVVLCKPGQVNWASTVYKMPYYNRPSIMTDIGHRKDDNEFMTELCYDEK